MTNANEDSGTKVKNFTRGNLIVDLIVVVVVVVVVTVVVVDDIVVVFVVFVEGSFKNFQEIYIDYVFKLFQKRRFKLPPFCSNVETKFCILHFLLNSTSGIQI